MVDIARLVVRMEAENAQLHAQLATSRREVNRYAQEVYRMRTGAIAAFKAVGAGAVAAFSMDAVAGGIKRALEFGDAIDETSARLGISAKDLQQWQYFGNQMGAEADNMTGAMGNLNNIIGLYQLGNAKATMSVGLLGDRVKDAIANHEDSNVIFQKALISLSEYSSVTDRAAVSQKVFGSAGDDMAVVAAAGADAINGAANEMHNMTTISAEQAKKAGELNDKWDHMAKELDTAVKSAFIDLGPVISWAMGLVSDFAKSFADDVSDIKRLSSEIGKAMAETPDDKATSTYKAIQKQKEDILDLYKKQNVLGGIFKSAATDSQLGAAQKNLKQLETLHAAQIKYIDDTKKQNDALAKAVNKSDKTKREKPIGAEDLRKEDKEKPPKNIRHSAGSAHAKTNPLDSEAKRLFEETRTPLEKLNEQLGLYDRLLAANKIDQDTFNRAVAESKGNYLESRKEFDPMLASMAEYNKQVEDAKSITEQYLSPLQRLDKDIAHLRGLYDSGLISLETFNRAMKDSVVGFSEQDTGAKEATDQMSEYAVQAAHNMQSAFADFLFDPFQNGIDGMALGFVDAIRQMVSQSLSAKLFDKVLGKDGKGGGWLDQGADWLGKAVGSSGSDIFGSIAGIFASLHHSGGIVGNGGGRMQSVNPALFGNAPRFHTGGFPGLKADEVPAILKKREEVLAANDPRNMLNRTGQQSGGSAAPAFNIINVTDESMIQNYIDSSSSDQVFINKIRKHSRTIKAALS